MVDKLATRVIQRVKEGECRHLHVSQKDHSVEAYKCEKCKAYVEVENGICICCHTKIQRVTKNFTTLHKVMNKFLTDYADLVDFYDEFPVGSTIDKSQARVILVRVKHGWYTYEVDVKWISKFREICNLDRLPCPAPNGKGQFDYDYFPEGMKPKDIAKIVKRDEKYNKYDSTMRLIDKNVTQLAV